MLCHTKTGRKARDSSEHTAATSSSSGGGQHPAPPGGKGPGGQGNSPPGSPPGPSAKRSQRGPMTGSSPVHTAVRFSYLSSERAWMENHYGLYNLAGIFLVVGNIRLALENALKYGWRLNPIPAVRHLLGGHGNLPLVACYPALLLMALLALLLELVAHRLLQAELAMAETLSKRSDGISAQQAAAILARREALHEWPVRLLATLNCIAIVALPWWAISSTNAEPLSGFILIMLACVQWMKHVSMHHCCSDLRSGRRLGKILPGERGCPDDPPPPPTPPTPTPPTPPPTPPTAADASHPSAFQPLLQYPESLTLPRLLYFLAAPTLVYQVNYPRTTVIRKKWLACRVFEALIVFTALLIIIRQYLQPTVANSISPLQEMDWLRVAERVLKLAVPSLYAWMAIFYLLFHLHLNILAELLRFGDREFYLDWWNAATLGDYWRTWNQPVHKWLLRHVYFPAVRHGCSRMAATCLVFFVSAVFHELVLGVPLHMVRLWAFCGIMFQVPLVILSEEVRHYVSHAQGNTFFWVCFCVVGQPLSILAYYHDWTLQNQGVQAMPHMAHLATNSTGSPT
ncbi:MAG: hypothetical protein WDW36_005360 [Sanguina aurantia]